MIEYTPNLFKFTYFQLSCLVLLLIIGSLPTAGNAQSFQRIPIDPISQMKNTYGTSVADFDRDGDLDLFIVAYEGYEENQPQTWSRLFENLGEGNWKDITVEAGFGKQFRHNTNRDNKFGASWGDYDNDGYPDLLLTHAGSIQLYHNLQDGRFTEVTQQANLSTCAQCINTGALWWDYDNDGLLDLYISDYGKANRLYHNLGDGTFADETQNMRLGDANKTWCSIAIDVNKDGWMDLYVVNDFGFSKLYISSEGQIFIEATQTYRLVNKGNAMGITIGDYNNDGNFDMYATNISEIQPNPLFTGTDIGYFTNEFKTQKVGYGDWAWGTKFFDADHDGDEDLYVVNGYDEFIYRNKFFKNMWAQGMPEFQDESTRTGSDSNANGMGLEVFDYDEDGDLDLLVSNANAQPYLYQNMGIAENENSHWLQLSLEGTVTNRNGWGAVVKATGQGRSYYRYHHGAGLMSQSIQPIHLGLGDLEVIDTLTVYWPGSGIEMHYNLPTNQHLTLKEQTSLTTHLSTLPSKSIPIQVSPNPFRSFISFTLTLPTPQSATLQIISPTGQVVFQENQGQLATGTHPLTWEGKDNQDIPQPKGIYFYRILLDNQTLSGKIILQ